KGEGRQRQEALVEENSIRPNRLSKHQSMALRRLDAELTKPPRLVRKRLVDSHATSAILLVQIVDTLIIHVSEQRVVAGLPGRPLALAIAHHQMETAQVQERPAADASLKGEPHLLREIGHRP